MASTTATKASTAGKAAEGQQNVLKHAGENGAAKNTTAASVPSAASAAAERDPVGSAHANEEDMLRAYSKELYVYTLDLLNAVRIDSAQKIAGGKAYLLKRAVSDIGVPLKGEAAKAAKESSAVAAPP